MSNSSKVPTNDQVDSSLLILESRTSSLEDKQKAFAIVRKAFVPVTNTSKEYATELTRVFALRFPQWPAPPSSIVSVTSSRVQHELADRIRGLVFGAALGDATGLGTEFLSRAEVEEYYDSGHIFRPSAPVHPDFHRVNFPDGDWTDDTDQLVLVLQTMLENQGCYDGKCFAAKMLTWKHEGFPGLGDGGCAGLGRSTNAVMNHPDFPTDPSVAAKCIWEHGGQKMAPNGAVMRTAITGVCFFWDQDMVHSNTLGFCRATHADPRCAASCLVVAEVVRRLLVQAAAEDDPDSAALSAGSVDEIIESAIAASIAAVPELDKNGADELRHHATAQTLDALGLYEEGKIGYTYKCLGSGLWALRSAAAVPEDESERRKAVQDILQKLVRAGGDADTNGAVAGALLGALIGFKGLPWTNELPYGGWLEAWVQKLLFMLRLPITDSR